MSKYEFPSGMRYTTLKEREQYYRQEFDISKVASWLEYWPGKIKFAVIMGRHTNIFLEKYEADKNTTILIDEYADLKDMQVQVLEFLPEGVYYDRNVYNEAGSVVGQELAFDLDPENVTCPVHGSLADKMARNQGLSFCEIELNMIKQQTIELCNYLENQFSQIKPVYSGRGFHVHVFDQKAFQLTSNQRLKLANQIKKKGFPIDEWVTTGENRLIRLPQSLNGLVSRIVTPLTAAEIAGFNPINDKRCIPKFLGQQ
jgi:DNA primase catalytic subunit